MGEEIFFDDIFYITEFLRFKGRLHAGKQRKIKNLAKALATQGTKLVLDVGCGGGHFSDIFRKQGIPVVGLDNPVAISWASRFHGSSAILFQHFESTPPAHRGRVSLFLDSLEFSKDMIQDFNKYKSAVNYLIMPNFDGRGLNIPFINPRKRILSDVCREIENRAYHSLYAQWGDPKVMQINFLRYLESKAYRVKIKPFNRRYGFGLPDALFICVEIQDF